MTYILKNPNRDQFPPGGFPYVDPKTGMRFSGFDGTVHHIAQQVSNHRRANPNLYPVGEHHWFDLNYIVQQIYEQKAGVQPWLFVGFPDQTPSATHIPQKTPEMGYCICGGSEVEEILCSTCGGRRVTGYKCKSCGKKRK